MSYRFEDVGADRFRLYDDSSFLLSFSRSSFRKDFERLACDLNKSSNWIGSMLRLFLKKFPPAYIPYDRNKISDITYLGESRLVEYLRSKGFRVSKRLNVTDQEVIEFLEGRGYEVEGLVNDCFYSSKGKDLEVSGG